MSTTPHRNLTSHTDTDPDQNTTTTRRSAPTTGPQAEKKFLDLSLTQVIGGSLAAATAAALGSTLGVAGTIVGAAVISILSAVGAALYTQSLRRTRDGVLSAVSVVKEKVSVNGVDSTRTDMEVVEPATPDDDPVIHDLIEDSADAPGEIERTTTTVTPIRRRALRPGLVLAGAAAVFTLTMAGIFGFELITGNSLSGGEGTTIQQVTGGGGAGSSDSAPTDNGTGGGSEQSADPSGTPTDPTSSAPSTSSAESSAPASSSSAGESSTPSATPSSPSPSSAPETTEPPAAVDPVEPNAAG